MEVSGRVYTPTALPPRKEPPVPVFWKVRWFCTLWGYELDWSGSGCGSVTGFYGDGDEPWGLVRAWDV